MFVASYNGDTIVINVSLVVELLLQLGVLLVRTEECVSEPSSADTYIMGHIRNTSRVEGSLVNVVGKHCDKVSIVFLVWWNSRNWV